MLGGVGTGEGGRRRRQLMCDSSRASPVLGADGVGIGVPDVWQLYVRVSRVFVGRHGEYLRHLVTDALDSPFGAGLEEAESGRVHTVDGRRNFRVEL